MKKLKNKEWLDRHARIKHRKELKRKYKFDHSFTTITRGEYTPYQSEEYYQSEKAQKKLRRRISQDRFKTIVAPEDFSIFSNPEETLDFFGKIQTHIKFGDPIEFDITNINNLSIDTILYFLAILQKIKTLKRVVYAFKGTIPNDQKCKKLLESSGFFEYVQYKKRQELSRDTEVIKIINGQFVDTSTVKNICDFTMEKLNLNRLQIKHLSEMIVELMNNTRQHAYENNDESHAIKDWYFFAKYSRAKNSVRFIFLDTGEGIPSTIKKKMKEKILNPIFGIGSHAEYINSALRGEFRSRTGKSYRGKGLPKIKSFAQDDYIKELAIISNQGYVTMDQQTDLQHKLIGTLFYWELLGVEK